MTDRMAEAMAETSMPFITDPAKDALKRAAARRIFLSITVYLSVFMSPS